MRKRCGKRDAGTNEAHPSSGLTWAWSSLFSRGATRWERERHKALRLTGPDWNRSAQTQICDEVRFCRLDKTYKADIKRITLNIVSPEKRLLVLEALGQTEAERNYGRLRPQPWNESCRPHGKIF